MFDKQRAAQWLVVAWCKEWSLGTYLDAIAEAAWQHDLSEDRIAEIQQAFPWMPRAYRMYGRSVREFVGATYPKLSFRSGFGVKQMTFPACAVRHRSSA